MKRVLIAFLFVAACGGGKKPAASGPGDAPTDDGTAGDVPAGTPAPEEVTFEADDGVTIAGTYYGPGPEAIGCFIFVHQLSSTRAEWQPLIDRLRGHTHILAFDMRGHGASTKGPDGPIAWKTFETADWEKVEGDIGKAVELIEGRRGGPSACVLMGSSIGSSAVLRFSGSHPTQVRALVLLSPGIGYRGVMTPDAARTSRAPVLIVHSQEKGAADAAGALSGIWHDATPPVTVEVIADPGQAHGMKIVNGDPKILERVVAFLREPPR